MTDFPAANENPASSPLKKYIDENSLPRMQRKALMVHSVLTNLNLPAAPVVPAGAPSITYALARTISGGRIVAATNTNMTILGHSVSRNDTFTAHNAEGPYNVPGVELNHTGSKFEFAWRAPSNAPAEYFWVFVDGSPLTAAPTQPNITTPGAFGYGYIDFGSARTRRITVYTSSVAGWVPFGTEASGVISPVGRRLRVALIGDSYLGGSNGTPNAFDLPGFNVGLTLGLESLTMAYGGSGYTTDGQKNMFGSAERRLSLAKAGTPDVIVFYGSVNDGDSPNLRAAAQQCFTDYALDFPDTPVIVIGPQPSNAVDTLSAGRASALAKVKAAALVSPNVIAFFDPCGTVNGVPQAWGSGQTYNAGSLVTYLGSVWAWAGPDGATYNVGQAPGAQAFWELVTWDYWGTGKSDALTGVGSRDALLYSDSVHPTTLGSRSIAARISRSIRAAVRTYATSGTRLGLS